MIKKLNISTKLKSVLYNIKCEISTHLLSLCEKEEYNGSHNFLNLSDTNDSVSFITQIKANQISSKILDEYKVVCEEGRLSSSPSNQHIYDALGLPRTNEIYRPDIGTIGKIRGEVVGRNGRTIYVLFENEFSVKTILNKESLSLSDDREYKFWNTNRSKIKIGRLVKSLCGDKVTASEVEKFVNEFKSTIDILNDSFKRFDLVEGKKINYWYESINCAELDGQLGNSCMLDAGSMLNIYSNNPEVCKMVILYDESGTIKEGFYKSEKIMGRALLWTLTTGELFMDRIYTSNDSDVEVFKKYADKMGWMYKVTQQSSQRFTYVKSGETLKNPSWSVQLKKLSREFPYLDTLTFLDKSEKKLSNKSTSMENIILNCTDGSFCDMDEDTYDSN